MNNEWRKLLPTARLKQIAVLLLRNMPRIRRRVQSFFRRRNRATTLSQTWSAAGCSPNIASPAHPILSNPDLLALARPAHIAALDQARLGDRLEQITSLEQMRQSGASVCFVVPVLANDAALKRTMQSIFRQTDPSWELLLSTPPVLTQAVAQWLDHDWRIRRITASEGATEAQQLKDAALQATADFVGLVSPGDFIDDDLVKLLTGRVRMAPESDMLYSDEASCAEGSSISHPFYKPDWSPEHQESVHMVGRFTAIRKANLLQAARPIELSDSAGEYGLALEVARTARQVEHLDDLLYFRATPPATPGGFFDPQSLEEARTALQRHVRHENAHAIVETDEVLQSLRVSWPVPEQPVTLLVLSGMRERELPERGKVLLVEHFVRSILSRSSFPGYRLVVVDDGVVPASLQALLADNGHSSVSYSRKGPFSFADKANFATSLVDSGIAILLNDDLEVISPDWIQILAAQAARPSIGAVGARLLFTNGTLQHAGIALGFHGSTGHMFYQLPATGREYAGFASINRNYSAVTGAVIAYRKAVFDEIGGFDEQFSTDYNDVDFCLKCIAAGYRVVYTPAATLYHFHNSSLQRASDDMGEREKFLQKWRGVVDRDPYFSKHFQTRSHELSLIEE